MNLADFDTLLTKTLADGRLSGSEKQALAAWLEAEARAESDRGAARSRVFDTARHAARTGDPQHVLAWLEDVLKVVAPVHTPTAAEPASAFFSPGPACLNRLAQRFAAARRSVDVCVFTITDDRIAAALLDAHRRGVAVRVVTDNDKAGDLGSDIDRIAAAGVPVRVDRTPFHMHHKYALFDGSRLLNGSYNWTRGAAEQNEENLTDTGDPRLMAAFQQHFETLWNRLG